MKHSRRQFLQIRAGCLLGAVALLWCVPPFHLVRLTDAQRATTAFNATAFVDRFWPEHLMKSLDRATDATALVSEIRKDPKAARQKYGRTAGLGGAYYYFLAGDGRVVSVAQHEISVSLAANNSAADVIIETGNIFGNAIRDGTGLLNVSDFSDSQDFNAVSSEINHRIEQQILPPLREKAVVGSIVHFAGCAEISDDETDLLPLRIVPLSAGVR